MRLGPLLATLVVAASGSLAAAPHAEIPIAPVAPTVAPMPPGAAVEAPADLAPLGAADDWPNPNLATIRPGNVVDSDIGQCTGNFIFTSPDNATLYIGVAAHCFNGMRLGDLVTIQGAGRRGTLAYTSWIALGLPPCNDDFCGGEYDHDFALVRIDAADRARVSPAVRHFGGPTSLGDSPALLVGNRVLTYGNSGLRPAVEALDWHEGIVSSRQGNTPTFYIVTVTPGIPGDSGSPVLGRDGRAQGVLVTLAIDGENGVTGLRKALDLARAEAGLDVRLATWPLIDDGLLP